MFDVLRIFLGMLALLAALSPSPALADPAGRVGRIALIEGPTLFRIDRDDAGTAATLNWPVSSGAILDTERGSRAEIWVGSSAFRMAGDSRLEFGVIDDHLVSVQLANGTLAITIADRDQADDIEVRIPNGRVQFGAPGRYRIDVGTERSNVATSSGIAYVYAGDRSSMSVGPGRTASIDFQGGVALYGEAPHDRFDDWTASREAATQARQARQYVSPQMTGYQDLDNYGDWGTAADYGSVWYPRAIPVGWAPYRQGRWAWVSPWGWTWVDAAPWGFAPFHYGRWVEVRGRWGWVPGAYVARPVYAPALVAWVGNPGWSASLSVGSGPSVGWFPLAPREVYVPAYRASPTYVRQVNITHITDVHVVDRAMADRGERHFAHRASPRAVTVVPASMVRDGKVIAASALPSRAQNELRQAPVSASAPTANWLAPKERPERLRNAPAEAPHVVAPTTLPSRDRHPEESRPAGIEPRAPAQANPPLRAVPSSVAAPLPSPLPSMPERMRAERPHADSRNEASRNEARPAVVQVPPSAPSVVDRQWEREHRNEAWAPARQPVVAPASAPAVMPERPQRDSRPIPMESRPPLSTMERPSLERRGEREFRGERHLDHPRPVASEPPRMERRASPAEERPANAPREERRRRHDQGGERDAP